MNLRWWAVCIYVSGRGQRPSERECRSGRMDRCLAAPSAEPLAKGANEVGTALDRG